MAKQNKLLDQLVEAVRTGELTGSDIAAALESAQLPSGTVGKNESSKSTGSKLSASNILFYIGGLVLYGALSAMISQTEPSFDASLIIMLGSGLVAWATAAYLLKGSLGNEQREGLGDAVLLTGSLAVINSVIIIISELISASPSQTTSNLIIFLGLVLAASLHFGMDQVVRRTITIVFTTLLGVAAYYSLVQLLFGQLINSMAFWGYVSIIAGMIFILAGHYFNVKTTDRKFLKNGMWGFGGFVILASAYGLMFSGGVNQLLWEIAFPFVLYLAFMVSVKYRSKNFLASGSFFLFTYVLTVSFRYFGDGLGAAFALMFAGLGIIGSAMLINHLRKKYFKEG